MEQMFTLAEFATLSYPFQMFLHVAGELQRALGQELTITMNDGDELVAETTCSVSGMKIRLKLFPKLPESDAFLVVEIYLEKHLSVGAYISGILDPLVCEIDGSSAAADELKAELLEHGLRHLFKTWIPAKLTEAANAS